MSHHDERDVDFPVDFAPHTHHAVWDSFVNELMHFQRWTPRQTAAMVTEIFNQQLLNREEFDAEMGITRMDRKQVIEFEIARLQKEYAELAQFGEDEFDDFTVLRISMKYPQSDIIYRYAAIKIGALGDKWSVTILNHRTAQAMSMSWAELVTWMKRHVVKLEVMRVDAVIFDKNAVVPSPELEAKARTGLNLTNDAPEDVKSGLDVQ